MSDPETASTDRASAPVPAVEGAHDTDEELGDPPADWADEIPPVPHADASAVATNPAGQAATSSATVSGATSRMPYGSAWNVDSLTQALA